MKHFAQALRQIINSPRLCSEVSQEMSKGLMRKEILLQEKDSVKIFKAKVVDYCFADEKGFVVSIDRNEASGLIRKYHMTPAEREGFVECDLRSSVFGDNFIFHGENTERL